MEKILLYVYGKCNFPVIIMNTSQLIVVMNNQYMEKILICESVVYIVEKHC